MSAVSDQSTFYWWQTHISNHILGKAIIIFMCLPSLGWFWYSPLLHSTFTRNAWVILFEKKLVPDLNSLKQTKTHPLTNEWVLKNQ